MNKSRFTLNRSSLQRAVYPIITITYVIVATALIITAIRFLSTTINRAITIDQSAEPAQLIRLDLDAYRSVAEELRIPLEQPRP